MGPLDALFAYAGEISVLRGGIFVLVFVLVYAFTRATHAFKDSKKLAFMAALAVSAIGVLGFSDKLVVGIMTGYSTFGLALLFLLPIIALVAVFFWKAQSAPASILKLIAALLLLGFVRMTVAAFSSLNAGLLTTPIGGVELDNVVGLIEFAIYGAIFFFGLDAVTKLLFSKES